jgi:hypothetical protein
MKRTRFDMYQRAVEALYGNAGEERNDANETAMFARQLEDIDTELYRVQYPELRGEQIVPVRTAINEGAEEHTYRVLDSRGVSRIIANYSEDLPRVDVQGKEVTAPLFGHGAAYGYSIQDMRRSRMTGLPLDSERAETAREVIATKNDEIIAFGESSISAKGFYNNAGVSLVSPVTGTWLTATGDQMLDDLLKLERAIIVDSNSVEKPDTLVLSSGQFALANTKRLSNTETTVLKFFLDKSATVKTVEVWARAETADAGGTGPRIAMGRRDPKVLQALLPLPFYQMAPEQRGLGFIINCDSRAGGVIFRRPKAWRYMDGC